MLKLSISVGTESTIVFGQINRTIVKFYQSDGQEAALTRLWIQRGGAAAEPPYDSMLEAHIAKRYVN